MIASDDFTDAAPAIRYAIGDLVIMRPAYLRRYPEHAGAQGIVTDVYTRILPAIRVLWYSGPREGREEKTPFYKIVPEHLVHLLPPVASTPTTKTTTPTLTPLSASTIGDLSHDDETSG